MDHEDAARFSFLLATPIIAAAGLDKSLTCSATSANRAIRFLVRFFEAKTLWPFAVNWLAAGAANIIRFA